MFIVVLLYFLIGTASIALGADAAPAPGCLDLNALSATWPWIGTTLATVAGSMGTIHLVTKFLLALPFVQARPFLVGVLGILSALGFNKSPVATCAAPAAAPEEKKGNAA